MNSPLTRQKKSIRNTRQISQLEHPTNHFFFFLDTTTANLWVPGPSCTNNKCSSKRKYKSESSSTFVNNGKSFVIQNGFGSTKGVLAQDTVKLGGVGQSPLVIPKTTFGVASSISTELEDDKTDGILGLAFQSIAVDAVVPPVINAINQKLLDKPLLTIFFKHQGTADNAGAITYGAVDTTNCKSVTAYQNLSSATYYQFKIAGISLGTYKSTSHVDAISDTSHSFLYGPKDVVAGLAKAADAKLESGLYKIDCKATPKPIEIVIGSHTYSINHNNYITELSSNNCLFAVLPLENGGSGPSWKLGTPFIKQYCHIYDIGHKRIGFAEHVN